MEKKTGKKAAKQTTKPQKLTLKQNRFVEEYCIHFNATRAAIAAGYSAPSAASIGHENLIKPEIKRRIDERVEQMAMSSNEALIRLTDMARASFQPFLHVSEGEDVTIVLSSEEAQANIHLIKKIKQTKRKYGEDGLDIITELELHDAKDAIIKVLQLHGKLIEKKAIDHTTKGEKIKQKITIFKLPDNGRGNGN